MIDIASHMEKFSLVLKLVNQVLDRVVALQTQGESQHMFREEENQGSSSMNNQILVWIMTKVCNHTISMVSN